MPLFQFIPDSLPEDHNSEIKSIKEEVWNMVSHGIGVLIFLLGSPFLLYKASKSMDAIGVLGVVLFCFSLILLYTASTIYHSIYKEKLRRKFRVFDHISIYFLIAGSYSPFVLGKIHTKEAYIVLITLWVMTAVGSILKLFFIERFNILSTLIYLIMGWMAVFIYNDLQVNLPEESILWILIGGAFYTTGVFFYLFEKMKFNHFIWHLFVLGGSLSHWVAVWLMLT